MASNFTPWVTGPLFNFHELTQIKKYTDNLPLEKGTLLNGEPVDENIRKCDVVFFGRNENNFWIFDKINSMINSVNDNFYNMDLFGYQDIQYTKYNSSGGKYVSHLDINTGTNNAYLTRKLSISILLNNTFLGGDFFINLGEYNKHIIKMNAGDYVVFPSFLLHGVSEITTGERESLVVWTLGPKFK